jgi:hypothetical protein
MSEAVRVAFVAGMEAAARLCDEEAHSAQALLEKAQAPAISAGPAGQALLRHVQEAASALAGSIRNFAADPDWVAEQIKEPPSNGGGCSDLFLNRPVGVD